MPAKKSNQSKPKKAPKKPLPIALSSTWNFIKKALKPLGFILIPFKTKPVRFVGRLLGKILFINYFFSSWKELRKVTWPNRRETLRLTLAVFIFSIVFGAIISLSDYGLDKVFKKLLLH